MTDPTIAACLADLTLEELEAFASSHDAAAAALTTQGRAGEANWQKAVAVVLAVALRDRAGEPPMYEIDDPNQYLAVVAAELDDVALTTSVFRFVTAFAKNRETLSPLIVAALSALNTPLLLEYQKRPPPPLVA